MNCLKVTIRPNLNTGPRFKTTPESSIHQGRLGRKIGSLHRVSIRCSGVVVRKAGHIKAQEQGIKSVYAGLIGELLDQFQEIPKGAKRIEYNPHQGDQGFHIEGIPYEGGGIISGKGHIYFLVSS